MSTPADEFTVPPPLSAAETVIRPPQRSWARRPLVVVVIGVLVTVMGLLVLPPDRILGATTRLVFFHGGIVWTAIILSLAGVVLSVLVLVRRQGPTGAGPRATSRSGARFPGLLHRGLSLATGFWVLTMALSFPVMQLSWGGVRWDEERLWMTVEITFLFLVLYALSLMIGRPRAMAASWLIVDVVMGVLLLTTPGSFHPDNPVFRSGSARYIGGFLIVVAGLQLVAFGLLFLRRVGAARSLA